MQASSFRIDSKTRLCGIVGHPVSSSPSPLMHNAAFRYVGYNAVYLAFETPREGLEVAVSGLRVLDAIGFNVTIPHKEEILPLLDGLEGDAREAGAVNTVVSKEERFIGHNTDVGGIVSVLAPRVELLRIGKVALFGAGGAARAFLVAASRMGLREVHVFNRSVERATRMTDDLGSRLKIRCEVHPLTASAFRDEGEYELIVSSVPGAALGGEGNLLLTRDDLAGSSVVFDMVYSPPLTPLLKLATDAGVEVVHGYEMLVEQARLAFRLWTDREVESRIFAEPLLRELGLD